MPVLPLVDLLILMGSASLACGFVVKVITVTTRYYPTPLGFNAPDFVVIAAICFGFALTLVARTWMKLNEPRVLAARREAAAAEGRLRAAEYEMSVGAELNQPASMPAMAADGSADRR